MYSVIIPTMWKCDRLSETLIELNAHPLVGEIILIDNTENTEKKVLDKLIHILEGKNTFVNPAWNKGVLLSKFDKIILLSDDNWMDWNILESLDSYITEQIGVIGMHWENIEIDYTSEPILIPTNHRSGNFGTVMFFHKNNWIPIPEVFKIWCGDDWIFVTNRRLKKQNYLLSNFKVEGFISLSSNGQPNSEIEILKENDLKNKNIYNLF